MTFVRFDTTDSAPAFIDPNTVRAIGPSRHGSDCALVVIDGGVKYHVLGHGPDSAFATLAPAGELGYRSASRPTSHTRQWCLDFAERMEERLANNRHKGDRPGWLAVSPEESIARARKNLDELEKAVRLRWNADDVWHLASDVANLTAMAADAYAESLPK